MNKYQKFFRDKSLDFEEHLNNEGDKEVNYMLLEEKKDRENLLIEVAKITITYKVIDTALRLSDTEFKKEYKRLGIIISTIFSGQHKAEYKGIEKLLNEVGNEKYNSSSYLLSLGLDFKLNKLSPKDLNKIINATIEGKNYSDRLWNNKNRVAKVLKKEIKDFLQGKTNVNEIEKIIKDRFNANAFNTKRLVRNEVGRVQHEVNEKWAKDNGIEYQIFDSTLDGKTSDICQHLDGTVYEVDDPSKRIPNVNTHINCRSCLISLPNKDYKLRMRIDNETKKGINWITYKEWENN